MRRLIFTVLLLFCTAGSLFSQETNEQPSLDVLLRKEHFFGAFISSAGGGIEFRKGINTTFFTKWHYEVNLQELKSERETRIYNPYFRNARSYIFGKMNNLYVLRAGGGQQKLLNRKPYWGGVEVRYFWLAGGAMGFAKPVYLYIINELSVTPFYYEYTLTTEKYDPSKHFLDNIYGRAPFTRGFSNLGFYPGAYAKAGFSFEIGRKNQKISAVELGAALDIFPTGVPMMALREPERYFLTFFVGYYFGKRYD